MGVGGAGGGALAMCVQAGGYASGALPLPRAARGRLVCRPKTTYGRGEKRRATRTKKALTSRGSPGGGPAPPPVRCGVSMHSRAFVVRVPHAACPEMGVQVVVMQDTLLVWCGAVPSDIEDEACNGAYAGALSRDWSVAMHVPSSTTMTTSLYRAAYHDDVSRRMSERLGTLGGEAHMSYEARSAAIVPLAGSAGCARAARRSCAGARGRACSAGAGARPSRGTATS